MQRNSGRMQIVTEKYERENNIFNINTNTYIEKWEKGIRKENTIEYYLWNIKLKDNFSKDSEEKASWVENIHVQEDNTKAKRRRKLQGIEIACIVKH